MSLPGSHTFRTLPVVVNEVLGQEVMYLEVQCAVVSGLLQRHLLGRGHPPPTPLESFQEGVHSSRLRSVRVRAKHDINPPHVVSGAPGEEC
jgi:hypothetical protein